MAENPAGKIRTYKFKEEFQAIQLTRENFKFVSGWVDGKEITMPHGDKRLLIHIENRVFFIAVTSDYICKGERGIDVVPQDIFEESYKLKRSISWTNLQNA